MTGCGTALQLRGPAIAQEAVEQKLFHGATAIPAHPSTASEQHMPLQERQLLILQGACCTAVRDTSNSPVEQTEFLCVKESVLALALVQCPSSSKVTGREAGGCFSKTQGSL